MYNKLCLDPQQTNNKYSKYSPGGLLTVQNIVPCPTVTVFKLQNTVPWSTNLGARSTGQADTALNIAVLWSTNKANKYSLLTRVSDLGGFYPDPDSTLEKKLDPDLTLKNRVRFPAQLLLMHLLLNFFLRHDIQYI